MPFTPPPLESGQAPEQETSFTAPPVESGQAPTGPLSKAWNFVSSPMPDWLLKLDPVYGKAPFQQSTTPGVPALGRTLQFIRNPVVGLANQILPELGPAGKGVQEGIKEQQAAFTSPLAAASLAGGGLLPKVAQRLVGLGFTAAGAYGLYKTAPEFKKAIDEGDTEKAARLGVGLLGGSVMVGLGAKGIFEQAKYFWGKQVDEAEATWKESGSPGDNEKIAAEFKKNRAKGLTPEWRVFWQGAKPEDWGTTPEKVQAYAKSIGREWTAAPTEEETYGPKTAPQAPAPTPAPAAGVMTPMLETIAKKVAGPNIDANKLTPDEIKLIGSLTPQQKAIYDKRLEELKKGTPQITPEVGDEIESPHVGKTVNFTRQLTTTSTPQPAQAKITKITRRENTRGGSQMVEVHFDDGTSAARNAGLQSDGRFVPWDEAIQDAIALKGKLEKGGDQNASKEQTPAAVHGNVPAQPEARTGEVPQPGSVGGIRPQASGGIPEEKGPQVEIQQLAEMPVADFNNAVRQRQGGLTGDAYRLGLSLKTPEDLAKLKEAWDNSTKSTRQLKDAGDFNNALAAGMRGQYFREAYEAATGTGSGGARLREQNPDYKPPFPEKEVTPVEKEKGKEKEGVLTPPVAGKTTPRHKFLTDKWGAAEPSSTKELGWVLRTEQLKKEGIDPKQADQDIQNALDAGVDPNKIDALLVNRRKAGPTLQEIRLLTPRAPGGEVIIPRQSEQIELPMETHGRVFPDWFTEDVRKGTVFSKSEVYKRKNVLEDEPYDAIEFALREGKTPDEILAVIKKSKSPRAAIDRLMHGGAAGDIVRPTEVKFNPGDKVAMRQGNQVLRGEVYQQGGQMWVKATDQANPSREIAMPLREGNWVPNAQIPEPAQPPTEPPGPGTGEGPGGAPFGFGPDDPQIKQLADSVQTLVDSKPGKPQLGEAFTLGERFSRAKERWKKALVGLRAAGLASMDGLRGKPVVTSWGNALGAHDVAMTESVINNEFYRKQMIHAVPLAVRRGGISVRLGVGDDDQLLEMMEQQAPAYYRKFFMAARSLTPEEMVIVNNHRNYFDARLDEAHNAGILVDFVDNYLHRMYPNDDRFINKILNELGSGIYTGQPGFAKERIYRTDLDAILAGLDPEMDFSKRAAAYDHALNKAIADRTLVKDLMAIKMPDGRPMIDVGGQAIPVEGEEGDVEALLIKPQYKRHFAPNPADTPQEAERKRLNERGDYKAVNWAPLREWRWVDTDENGKDTLVQGDVLVHKDAVNKIKKLFEPSAIRQFKIKGVPVGRAMMGTSNTVKQIAFDLSLFHPTQLTVHGLEHRVFEPYNKWVAKALGTEMTRINMQDPDTRGLVFNGLVLADHNNLQIFQEGSGGSLLTRLMPFGIAQLAQDYQHWLFHDWIPRLKLRMALHALARNREAFPELSQAELYTLTANQANSAFGELNWRRMGVSRTMQDALRLTFVAPDFLLARGQYAGQALVQGLIPRRIPSGGWSYGYGREQTIAMGGLGFADEIFNPSPGNRLRNLALATLGLGMVTNYILARILNKWINGSYHFELANAFSVIYKGKAYSLRTAHGDLLHMATDFPGFWFNRLNAITGATTIEFLSGRDQFGRTRTNMEQLQDLAARVSVPISLRGYLHPREQALWESFLNMVGITEHRSSSIDNIYKLAENFKKANNIAEPAERIYNADRDPYRGIKLAALYRSPEEVATEIDRAIKARVTNKDKLAAHFKEYATRPFSGSKKLEPQFIKSLTEDQRGIYKEARLERFKMIDSLEKGWAIYIQRKLGTQTNAAKFTPPPLSTGQAPVNANNP